MLNSVRRNKKEMRKLRTVKSTVIIKAITKVTEWLRK